MWKFGDLAVLRPRKSKIRTKRERSFSLSKEERQKTMINILFLLRILILSLQSIFLCKYLQVDLKTFASWEDSPEKMMLDMMSNPNAVRREDR